MRFIPTRIHGAMDYVVGILLIILPLTWGSITVQAAVWVPVVLGAGLVFYSLMTAYEWGVFKVIGMSTHLMLDVIGGFVLAISPWIFGFADVIYLPHLIIGAIEVLAGLTTSSAPVYTGRPAPGV